MTTKPAISFRLSPEEIEYLDRFGAERSAQLREDMDTLRSLIRESERRLAGKFTVAEGCLICDVCNGLLYQPEFAGGMANILFAEVSDGMLLNELDKKWVVDRDVLIKKLQGLLALEAYVVLNWARLFWHKYKDVDTEAAVKTLFQCPD